MQRGGGEREHTSYKGACSRKSASLCRWLLFAQRNPIIGLRRCCVDCAEPGLDPLPAGAVNRCDPPPKTSKPGPTVVAMTKVSPPAATPANEVNYELVAYVPA